MSERVCLDLVENSLVQSESTASEPRQGSAVLGASGHGSQADHRRSYDIPVGVAGGLLALGCAAASPVEAQFSNNTPYASFGTFVTYTFGAEQGVGVGLEARAGVQVRELAECNADPAPFFHGGGAIRFEWFPAQHARLLMAAQGGRVFGSISGARGEVGVGYRWGDGDGLETLLGAELDISFAALAIHVEPLRAEVSPALGIFFPTVTMPTMRGCWVAGRPLRAEEGFAELPSLAFSEKETDVAYHSGERAVCAANTWGQRAQTEWASVPAFRELAAQLRVAGAPRGLIGRGYEAARDELRHAVLAAGNCAAIAGGQVALDYGGVPNRPLRRGEEAWVRLAVESWVDGCLGEGAAAACAAEEARVASEGSIATTQLAIAADEASHAQLAWDVLDCSLDAGGQAVRTALRAVAEADPSSVTETAGAQHAKNHDLESFGILSAEHQQAVVDEQRKSALDRLARRLS